MKHLTFITLAGTLLLTGCATREYVHEYVDAQMKPVSGHVDAVDGRVGGAEAAIKSNAAAVSGLQSGLKEQGDRIAKNAGDISQVSQTAQDALQRATAAGKLAEGKFVYELVLSDDKVKFPPDKTSLSKEAQAMLDEFAAKLKQDNKNVFIEIQGHTDSRGEAAANLKLGEARAQAVRNYLSIKDDIPLHRMSVISYGESAPVADNRFKAGRAQNRRVVLVVID